MTPPDQSLKLIERSERNLDKYKRPDYKEARVRVEHEDIPDNQDRVAAGVRGWLACGGRLRSSRGRSRMFWPSVQRPCEGGEGRLAQSTKR